MAQFLSTLGLNPADARSMLGANSTSSNAASTAASHLYLEYVRIDPATMRHIEEVYMSEPLICTANRLKSDHSLGREGFEVVFAGKKVLKDERYHHIEALITLLEHARRWRDMFGFCIVQDSSARLVEEVREVEGDPIRDDDDPDADTYSKSHTPGTGALGLPVVDVEQRLTEVASKYIYRVTEALGLPDIRENLLGNVRNFNAIQATVNGVPQLQSQSVSSSFGPALPRIAIGEVVSPQQQQTGVSRSEGDSADDAVQASLKQQADELATANNGIEELFTRLRYLRPVDFRDGDVYLCINRFMGERSMVFTRRARRPDDMAEDLWKQQYEDDVRDRKLPRGVIVDDTVKIFVWPGLMPSDEGRLRTQMQDAINKLAQAQDADRRRILADESSVRPTVFVSYEDKVSVSDVRQLSEQELINLATDPTQKDQRDDSRHAVAEFIQGVTVELINNKRRDEFAKAVGQGLIQPTGETVTRRPTFPALSAPGTHQFQELPRGYSVSQVVQGTTIDNVAERLAVYEQHIAGLVGIPLLQLRGGSGNSRKGATPSTTQSGEGAVTGGSAEMSSAVFRPTIMEDRNNLRQFFGAITDLFWRSMSNTEMARLLAIAKRERRIVTKKNEVLLATVARQGALLSEAALAVRRSTLEQDSIALKSALVAQFQAVSDRIRQVSAMEHQFDIAFSKQTFVDYQEINALVQLGAITPFEAANMTLAKMCLPPITEAQFEQNRKRKLDDMQAEVVASQPPPEPDSGPPASKKK